MSLATSQKVRLESSRTYILVSRNMGKEGFF